MDIKAAPSGSQWRRWDLHIHAPGTKLSNSFGDPRDAAVWDRFLEALESSPVDVFGVTDYFCCDTYFEVAKRFQEKYPHSSKVFFPNAEFRLAESISANGGHPHIHVVFDNGPELCTPEKLNRFFTNLGTHSPDPANVRRRCADLKAKADFESATVTLHELTKALEETFGDSSPYLIGFPANNDGLRSTDSSIPRNVEIADTIDKAADFFWGNERNRDFCLSTTRYKSGLSKPKPVISGSDAHSFDDLDRLSGDVAGFPSTWIKADATFTGLKQICYEPDNRVFIGSEPEVVSRQREDGTRFLRELEIDQISSYDEKNGRWFKVFDFHSTPS
jgi:hypothetical protein